MDVVRGGVICAGRDTVPPVQQPALPSPAPAYTLKPMAAVTAVVCRLQCVRAATIPEPII